jgi:hypothetical protein
MTEEHFEEKIIPRACFPAHCNKELYKRLERVTTNFLHAKNSIVTNTKPLEMTEGVELASVAYKGAVERAQFMKEHHRNTNGVWKIDEDGNETYVEGWMF